MRGPERTEEQYAYLLSRHNLTAERFDALWLAQDGRCAICGLPEGPGGTRQLLVDHDHSCCPSGSKQNCGECARGLLCSGCNARLSGWALERLDTIRAYLVAGLRRRYL